MIKPTTGRIVLFTPATRDQHVKRLDTSPMSAIVTYVWNDRLVNLTVFDHNGIVWARTSVTLLQDDDRKPEEGYFATWMEYQKGQAAKYDELAKVKADPVDVHGNPITVEQMDAQMRYPAKA